MTHSDLSEIYRKFDVATNRNKQKRLFLEVNTIIDLELDIMLEAEAASNIAKSIECIMLRLEI